MEASLCTLDERLDKIKFLLNNGPSAQERRALTSEASSLLCDCIEGLRDRKGLSSIIVTSSRSSTWCR